MLIASLGLMWGLREGIRYSLLSELDENLQDDFGEISLALSNVFEPTSRFFHAGMDRKARGHKQRSWFLQLVSGGPSVERDEASQHDGDRQLAAEVERLEIAPSEVELESSESELVSLEDPSNDLTNDPTTPGSSSVSLVGPSSGPLLGTPPPIIWQTYNVPDWTTLSVPINFDRFVLEDGVATTVDHYRVMERTVHNALGGPVRVRIGASMQSIRHASEATDRMMLVNILAAIVIAPMGGYWLALRATRPLDEMIRTTDRLRPQQLDERLPIRNTGDEIDQLSGAFNRMLDRIAEYLVKRQDLLANSAHELRTPLAALRSTAELALNSDRSADEYRELLESIVSECGNLEQLVNQLLLLSETEAAHFETRGETVDLSKITGEACDMFGAVAESRGVVLHTEISPHVLVDGSRMHLRQLLNNLIDNAIKFIPGEGRVTVVLTQSAAGTNLTVRDTGVGIAAQEQKHLFERFYRGDKARRRHTPTKGTGLGLSICRAIAEAHGGTISIESQPGVGTAVIVMLPGVSRSI